MTDAPDEAEPEPEPRPTIHLVQSPPGTCQVSKCGNPGTHVAQVGSMLALLCEQDARVAADAGGALVSTPVGHERS